MADGTAPHDSGIHTVISADRLAAAADYLPESGDLPLNFRVFLKRLVHRFANDPGLSSNRGLGPAVPKLGIGIHAGSETLDIHSRLIDIRQ